MFYDTSTPFVSNVSSDILFGLHIHSFLGPLELGIWTHSIQHLRPLVLGIGASGKAWVMSPFLILSPFLEIPENAKVTRQLCPLLGPRDGKGEVANSNFVRYFEGPRERKGCVAIAPFSRPLTRQE